MIIWTPFTLKDDACMTGGRENYPDLGLEEFLGGDLGCSGFFVVIIVDDH